LLAVDVPTHVFERALRWRIDGLNRSPPARSTASRVWARI